MNLAFIKTPSFVKWIFPKQIWAFSNSTNKVYLTFDDGPIPQVTPWVLKTLEKYNAKATFFCIGDNIRKHPAIFKQLVDAGHSIGNHTYHHLNGWKTSYNLYSDDIEQCAQEIKKQHNALLNSVASSATQNLSNKKIFRPPYGKITKKQSRYLLSKDYKIIMWDVLSKDYDTTITQQQCLHNVLKHIQPGSIIVFHDSLKAEKNLKYALPKVLEHIKRMKWECSSI